MDSPKNTLTLRRAANKITDYQVVMLALKRFREEQDLTWNEVAAKAEIKPSTLSAILNGHRSITSDNIEALAHAFDVDSITLLARFAEEKVNMEINSRKDMFGIDLMVGKDEYLSFAEDVIADLQNGDRYFLICTQPPVEFGFTNSKFVQTIINAAKRGVCFHYIMPTLTPPEKEDAEKEDGSNGLVNQSLSQDDKEKSKKKAAKLERADTFFWSLSSNLQSMFEGWKAAIIKYHPEIGNKSENIRAHFIHRLHDTLTFAVFIKYIVVERGNGVSDSWIEVTGDQQRNGIVIRINPEATQKLFEFCHKIRMAFIEKEELQPSKK